MRSVAAFVCALCLLGGTLGSAGCPDKEDEAKRVIGVDGRERWIVAFEGNEPDLAEYRGLMKDKPAEAEAYADKMRRKLGQDHEEVTKTLESLNGTIVERWWMSNAITVELEVGKAPSLEKAPGVKSLTPDIPLEP